MRQPAGREGGWHHSVVVGNALRLRCHGGADPGCDPRYRYALNPLLNTKPTRKPATVIRPAASCATE